MSRSSCVTDWNIRREISKRHPQNEQKINDSCSGKCMTQLNCAIKYL